LKDVSGIGSGPTRSESLVIMTFDVGAAGGAPAPPAAAPPPRPTGRLLTLFGPPSPPPPRWRRVVRLFRKDRHCLRETFAISKLDKEKRAELFFLYLVWFLF